jgi:purine-binding chemotaxis protein CheW
VVFFRFKLSLAVALGSNLKKPVRENKSTTPVEVTRVRPVLQVPDYVHAADGDEEDEVAEARELMCVFRAGTAEYAIPISLAKEVVKMRRLAPIPQMPKHIIGLANVRGSIYGVLDLQTFFGHTSLAGEQGAFLLVLNDDKYKICISIPNVPDTLYTTESMKETNGATQIKTIKKREFVQGIIKKDDRLIVQLNIKELIASSSLINEIDQSAKGQNGH